MNLLTLDTSGSQLVLGICRDTSQLEFQLSAKESSSSLLLPAIESSLKLLNLSVSDLDAFGISLGPGSFTSLRVGLAALKGLCLVDEKPLVGFSTLESLAIPVQGFSEIAVATKARKGHVYFQTFTRHGDQVQSSSNPVETPLSEVFRSTRSFDCILGSGVREAQEELRQALSDTVVFLDSSMDTPRGSVLLKLTRSKVESSDFLNLDTAEPIYLKPSMAEIKAEERAQRR